MKTFSKILFAGIMLAAGTLTSCTDYQDEIDALDDRVTILENLVQKVNEDIKDMQGNLDALEDILNAMKDGWIITGLAEVDPANDPQGRGYRIINFGKIDPNTGEMSTKPEDKKVAIIYNGLQGEDGLDASAPDIDLRYDPEDGNYYWVVDGQWLLDDSGRRIRANGEDGKDGTNGKNGKDGKDGKSTAPLLGVNGDGEWIVSFDGGEKWEPLLDENGKPIKATGKDGKDGKNGDKGQDAFEFIKSVTISLDSEGNRFVVFVLYDGTEVRLPLK